MHGKIPAAIRVMGSTCRGWRPAEKEDHVEDEARKSGHSEEPGDTDAEVEGHRKELHREEAGRKELGENDDSGDDTPDVEGHRHEASRHEAGRHEAGRHEAGRKEQ